MSPVRAWPISIPPVPLARRVHSRHEQDSTETIVFPNIVISVREVLLETLRIVDPSPDNDQSAVGTEIDARVLHHATDHPTLPSTSVWCRSWGLEHFARLQIDQCSRSALGAATPEGESVMPREIWRLHSRVRQLRSEHTLRTDNQFHRGRGTVPNLLHREVLEPGRGLRCPFRRFARLRRRTRVSEHQKDHQLQNRTHCLDSISNDPGARARTTTWQSEEGIGKGTE